MITLNLFPSRISCESVALRRSFFNRAVKYYDTVAPSVLLSCSFLIRFVNTEDRASSDDSLVYCFILSQRIERFWSEKIFNSVPMFYDRFLFNVEAFLVVTVVASII